jgi:DNA-binding transcriptional MocR family regulator
VPELLLAIDRTGGLRGRSLENALRDGIRGGRLATGLRLPGSRSLAADLGLSRGTVVQAYAQLVAEGWLVPVPGSGTRVADVPAARPENDGTGPAAVTQAIELRPGVPDLSSFPRTAWARSVRRSLSTAPNVAFDYAEPTGLPVLRAALAGYLARTRGVRADPDAIVVTAGFTQGLSLLGRALRGRGVRAVATEDPGLHRHRLVLHAAGLATTPLAVDADGARPGDLAGQDVQAVLLTPAHQHPTGVVLAARRRSRFLGWAAADDAFLIEDDYDGEFRYDQRPVGAMQALAPDRIVFAGSTSKSLAPGVRLAWLVVPEALRPALLEAILGAGAAVSALDQLAMADLLVTGEYDRHIRRMRHVYRRRRAQLADRLATVTGTPLAGIAAGMHALLPLGSAGEEHALVRNGRRAGLHLTGLHTSGYWHDAGDAHPAALILGYAAPTSYGWDPALSALTALLGATGPGN